MLETGNIITTLLGETVRESMARGYLQVVLLPMLWSLVVGKLLWELNDRDYYTTGEANDIATLSLENFLRLCQRFYRQL
jgi:hypothetical protein